METLARRLSIRNSLPLHYTQLLYSVIILSQSLLLAHDHRPKLTYKDYSSLLGDDLLAAGFTLISNGQLEFLDRYGTRLKRWKADKYSLKAVKRYCKLYLQTLQAS